MLMDFRTYFLNKMILGSVGYQYNWQQHKQYHQILNDKELPSMSLKGVLEEGGETDIGLSTKASDAALETNLPIIQEYLGALQTVSGAKLSLRDNFYVETKLEMLKFKEELKREWTLSSDKDLTLNMFCISDKKFLPRKEFNNHTINLA